LPDTPHLQDFVMDLNRGMHMTQISRKLRDLNKTRIIFKITTSNYEALARMTSDYWTALLSKWIKLDSLCHGWFFSF